MSTNNSRPRDSTGAPKKKECYTFEPQQWRRSVCKNCFRSLHDHPTEPPSTGSTGGNGKGLSPRTSPLLGTKSLPGANVPSSGTGKDSIVLRKGEASPTSRRRPKSDEFKQKTPSPRQSQRSLTSSGRKSPGSSPTSSTTRHSGTFTGQNRQNSTSSIDTKYVEELENDFFDLEDKYDGLSKEKTDLESDINEKNRTIEELQEDVEAYKIKILQLERRVQHLDEEIHSYRERLRLPESDQASSDANARSDSQQDELLAENEQLRMRLEEIEQLCQEVMEENELLKEEQEEMQREIEEMHDHFQEDDTDTLRELKRDLESSNKNCRIFQFKLRKTERRYEQCENERAVLEDKLNRLESQLYSENDVNLIRGLEEELRVAKEVSVRLNSELELVDEKRSYFEEDNKHMKEDLQDSEKRRKTLEGELSKCRQEIEKLKSIDSGTLTIPETHNSKKTKFKESISREPSFEEQSLQRELDAAKERETDLNEQLKFSEDEIRKLKRRLNDAEEENDSLSKKLESIMINKNIDDNDYEDLSVHALKMQMEILEKENSTLRKKLVLIEKENASLMSDARKLIIKNSQEGHAEFSTACHEECGRMKEQLRQYDDQIKDIIRTMGQRIDDQKQLDMLVKYGEVQAHFREQQREITQIRSQMDAMNEEYEQYKEFYDKHSKTDVKRRSDTKSGLENASKTVLLDEIGCLEEEIDELVSKRDKLEIKALNLSQTVTEKNSIIEELMSTNENNDKELNQYIQHILTKNSLLNDLLSCVESRANDLQAQFDRIMSRDAGSTTEHSDNDEKFKVQLSFIERQLMEAQKRTQIAEMVQKDGARTLQTDDGKLMKREIEMLKRELEERNEILEEKEQNLSDLRSRLDQTRKMNEALKSLLDKQEEGALGSPPQKTRGSKENSIEIASYKKEISIMKAELHQYAIKINESEKIREKLAKEIRNLQAEMKIREEQIYEQDDEMRAKDQEMRSIKKTLEETQSQSLVKIRCAEVEEKDLQIEMLNEEMTHIRKALHNYKSHSEELEMELRQSENQQKVHSDSIRARDERIKEKDDLISHLSQRLQHRESELSDFDSLIKETNEKLNKHEEIIKTMQIQVSTKEIDIGNYRTKNDDLQSSYDKLSATLHNVTNENEAYKTRLVALEKENSKPPIIPRISTASSSEIDKLKSDVIKLKKEKESIMEMLNKSKGAFSVLKKESDSSKNDADAYTKAIQQQQYLTRVALLSDNVTRLNRVNIELKLHNESIQNDMLEYQRRYKNVKEQFESEEEAWAAERITLESRMKEFEDRKTVIAGVRKSLQDASLKVAGLEALLAREKHENEMKIGDLEKAKYELKKRLAQYEEKEKLPKVFQRFGGKMSSRTANEIVQDKEKTELKVKLEAADKMIQKLRSEIVEREEHIRKEKTELITKTEETRTCLEGLIHELSDKLTEMEGIKEQMFILKERIYTLEECQNRDRKLWSEERMMFQFRLEDSRMMIENWLERIKEAENAVEEGPKNVMTENLEKEIENYLASKECIPYAQMCRRIQSQQEQCPNSTPSNEICSIIGKPPMKSNSLDWTNRAPKSLVARDLATSNQSINISPYTRSNRSMSPDQARYPLTTRKITNYPDPTPGFLLKSSSRQSSTESVSKDSDYTQRSFTLPGMRNNHNASRISPARQRFFETDPAHPTALNSSETLESKNPHGLDTQDHLILDRTPTTTQDTKDEICHVHDVKVTFSEPVAPAMVTPPSAAPIQDYPQVRSIKPKSISIAPSIQQLRMKFAQKSSSTTSADSSTSKK